MIGFSRRPLRGCHGSHLKPRMTVKELYETLPEAQAAADTLTKLHPDWWIAAAAPFSADAG